MKRNGVMLWGIEMRRELRDEMRRGEMRVAARRSVKVGVEEGGREGSIISFDVTVFQSCWIVFLEVRA